MADSYLDQYRNADKAYYDLLERLNNEEITRDEFDTLAAGFKNAKLEAGIGAGLTALSGATQLFNIGQQQTQIADTTQQRNMIGDLGRVGGTNYSSYDQVINDYNQLGTLQPNLDYDAIRGGSWGQRAGNTFNSALTGATTGFQIGGPWGALAGGVIGLGAGIGGWLAGDKAAELEQSRLNMDYRIASQNAATNLSARNEELADWGARKAAVNSVAKGGKIQTMKDFADRVLKKSAGIAVENNPSGIVRKHCKGGTMVRIKR